MNENARIFAIMCQLRRLQAPQTTAPSWWAAVWQECPTILERGFQRDSWTRRPQHDEHRCPI